MDSIISLFRKLFGASDEAPAPSNQPLTGTKKALCVGISDYPGTSNDLQWCVNDCQAWSDLLKSKFGFSARTLVDSQATRSNFVNEFKNLLSLAQPGDHLVVTYSGHGSTVIDEDGDEPDGRDETLYLYDGNLVDDEIRTILSTLPGTVGFTFISDSCHSGTVTRAVMGLFGNDQCIRPRYMPPADNVDAATVASLPTLKRVFYAEGDMKGVLLAGCRDMEYSYDGDNTMKMGVMSYHATNILKENPPMTYEDFYAKLRTKLPNAKFPQTPQLEGRDDLKKKIMFS